MDFNEKLKLTGHLEVIKIDNKTGEETVLFDDHNVITSGLGQSIAQFMTASGCYNLTPSTSSCLPDSQRYGPRPSIVPEGTENQLRESADWAESFAAAAADTSLPKHCYYFLYAKIVWTRYHDGDVDDDSFILKTCLCMDKLQHRQIKKDMDRAYSSDVNFKALSISTLNTMRLVGYELIERDCMCRSSSPKAKCKGTQEFKLLGPEGRPLNLKDGAWVTSTGEIRQFPSKERKDIMQAIVDVERGLPLACCGDWRSSSSSDKKYNSSSSTNTGTN